MLFVKENGRYAVFGDDWGRIVKISDFIYDYIGTDSDGAAYAVRDGKKYYLDFLGGESDKPATEYTPVIQQIGDLSIVQKYGEKEGKGVIDGDGNYVIPAEYAIIFAASEDRFFCAKEKGRYGMIYNEKGEIIADGFSFSYPLQAQDLKNTLYIVGIYENGRYVPKLIDKDGNFIKPGETVLTISYGSDDTYIINGKTVFTPN